jgi:hypothetical protein
VYLEKFSHVVTIMGGSSEHMDTLLPTYLKGKLLKWLRNKVPGSIRSWEDLTQGLVQVIATKDDPHTQHEEFKNIR